MNRSRNRRSITRQGQLNLVCMMATCLLTGALTTWTHDWFAPIFFWFLIVLFMSVMLYAAIALATRPVSQFVSEYWEDVVEKKAGDTDDSLGRSWEPLIIDKDYANLDVEVWAEDVAGTLLKISDSHAPGVSDERLDEVEKKLDFTFPPAFRALYRRLNGAEGLPNLYSIWTLEEMIHEYNDQNNNDFIPFADAMIRSWFIGFEKDLGAIVNDVALQKPITDNFMHAIDLIIADAPQIY